MRIGHGYDIHRLQSGGQLMLAGVKVANGVSPISHSDGDVVIHAIVDAVLGALAMGDIGQHFPDTDPRYKNVSSVTFLSKINEFLADAGYRIVNCDVTILAERPRLGAHKESMTASLRDVLDCNIVNIKAGTNEGLGEIGRG